MPDGQGQASHFDLGSAERIEVLRGPFSAMYGNSSGGVINVDHRGRARRADRLGPTSATAATTRWRIGLKFGAASAAGVDGIADVSRFDTDGYRDHSAATRDQLNAQVRHRRWASGTAPDAGGEQPVASPRRRTRSA